MNVIKDTIYKSNKLSVRGYVTHFLLRYVLYVWISAIVLFSGIFDLSFMEDYMSESIIIYALLFFLFLFSLWGVVTRKDEMAFLNIYRMRYGKYLLLTVFISIWVVVLVVWYAEIDGARGDVEASYFYYTPLMILMSMPGSILLFIVDYILHIISNSDYVVTQVSPELSLDEFRLHAIKLWGQYFILFLVQVYTVNKWLSKRITRKRDQ